MKPRPVLIFGGVLAGLTAVTTYADVENMIPGTVLNWIRLGTAVGAVVWTFYVQSVVTPLSQPVAKDGRTLVPSPPAEVPAGTTEAQLDATEKAKQTTPGGLDLPH